MPRRRDAQRVGPAARLRFHGTHTLNDPFGDVVEAAERRVGDAPARQHLSCCRQPQLDRGAADVDARGDPLAFASGHGADSVLMASSRDRDP